MRKLIVWVASCALIGAGCGSQEPPSEEASEEPAITTQRSTPARPGFSGSDKEELPAQAALPPGATPQPTTRRSPFPVLSQRQMPGDPLDLPLEPITEEVAEDDIPGEPVNPEDIPQEGDEIMVPPQMLGVLFPQANFDAVTRTEPININSMLEQMGIVLTNYQQLIEMGLTNYQILRYQEEESPAAPE